MKKSTWIIIAILLISFAGLTTWSIVDRNSSKPDFSSIDQNSILPASSYNGEIADHVKGNPAAPVIIYEYADYQCPACATMNLRLAKLLKSYGERLGIVYRHFLSLDHQNALAASSAAEAAGLQGYWQPYADLLFSNRSSWSHATPSERDQIFSTYFQKVSNNQGDLAKFRQDLTSKRVKQKIDFDIGLGNKLSIKLTPTLILDGQIIDYTGVKSEEAFLSLLREKIDAKLKSQKP